MPSRRRYLQALCGIAATALAGCQTGDRPTTAGTPSSEATPTETPTPPPSPTPTDTSTPEPLTRAVWSQDRVAGVVRNLTFGEQAVYAATDGRDVVALDPADGTVRWQVTVEGSLPHRGAPEVNPLGGTVYATSTTRNTETLRGYLEALDPATGRRRWRFDRREFLDPVGVVDDTLYVAGHHIRKPPSELGVNESPLGEGRLHALDVTTGETRWTLPVPPLSSAAVADHGLYVHSDPDDGSPEETLRVFGLDGDERWQVDTGTVHLDRPVPADRGVLAGADGDGLALYAPDGTRRWSVSGWEWGPSQVVDDGKHLFVGAYPLVSVTSNGLERWRRPDWGVAVTPVTRETLYAQGNDTVGALDPDTGEPRWTYAPDGVEYLHTRGVVDDGLLVSARGTQGFVLLDEDTGESPGRIDAGIGVNDTLTRGSRLFIGGEGGVAAFDVAH